MDTSIWTSFVEWLRGFGAQAGQQETMGEVPRGSEDHEVDGLCHCPSRCDC